MDSQNYCQRLYTKDNSPWHWFVGDWWSCSFAAVVGPFVSPRSLLCDRQGRLLSTGNASAGQFPSARKYFNLRLLESLRLYVIQMKKAKERNIPRSPILFPVSSEMLCTFSSYSFLSHHLPDVSSSIYTIHSLEEIVIFLVRQPLSLSTLFTGWPIIFFSVKVSRNPV